MPVSQLARKILCCCATVLPFVIRGLYAQTNSLILSPAAAKSRSAVMLDLSLHSSEARPVSAAVDFSLSAVRHQRYHGR